MANAQQAFAAKCIANADAQQHAQQMENAQEISALALPQTLHRHISAQKRVCTLTAHEDPVNGQHPFVAIQLKGCAHIGGDVLWACDPHTAARALEFEVITPGLGGGHGGDITALFALLKDVGPKHCKGQQQR